MNEVFLQYGALGGIALLALLAVKVMYANAQRMFDQERSRADAALQQERARGDRLEDEVRKLNEMIRSDYVSTISQATRAIADAIDYVRRAR